MNGSRTDNTRRILSSSFINLGVSSVLAFVNRTLVIYCLGAEFTGLSGLFSSIIQVLSLAEFGFSMVIVYYLYTPLANGDIESINQILSWLRRTYHIVGGTILCSGIICTTFLTYLIHGNGHG